MRKRIFGFAVAVIMLFGGMWLSSCSGTSHGIPNGWYNHYSIDDGAVFWGSDYGWYIKGNKADYYSSGQRTSKCKIVEKDGKLYFEGHQTYGEENVLMLEVEYCKSTKVLTIGTSDKAYFFKPTTHDTLNEVVGHSVCITVSAIPF